MIYSLLRFDSRGAWSNLMAFYNKEVPEGDDVGFLLNPDFKEDFLRKNVMLCFGGGGADDTGQFDQSWSRSIMTRLGLNAKGVKVVDVNVREWCWTIDITATGYQVCGPGGLEMSGADYTSLRSYLELDKAVDGYEHYLGSQWDWSKMLLPPVPRELNVLIWDSYLLRENLVKKNLVILLERLHWERQVERVRCFICIMEKSISGASLNNVENLRAEIKNVERATDGFKVDCVIAELSGDAGFGVGGHGRFLVTDTFCVRSGKGFNLNEDGLDQDKRRPDAEGVDVVLNLTRLTDYLKDFEQILGRVRGVVLDSKVDGRKGYVISDPQRIGDCGANFYDKIDELFKMWSVHVSR